MMKRHASVSAETASKLREIIAVFKHDASKLNMHGWGYKYDKRKTKAVQDAGTQTSSCGTVGCIAGWACFLNLKPKELKENLYANSGYEGPSIKALEFRENDITQVANSLLGLPPNLGREGANLHPLFFVAGWPQEFMSGYMNAETAPERARITIKRINHYIATGE